ncbi:unnamed protein product [Chondrus crispus]|uniref:Cytochrome b561 domain-containing protein n=1 Tax=Chondrus crispus TaxID=2769 RepID=R7QFL5_CHOCR|nr:unnamed protein product [Chondrus crispus]CDF36215.1 unnamed protein product [Chondrus crispus]|eukprot:XP_005716034.1 unnamed protein product [Chondrus crispus]
MHSATFTPARDVVMFGGCYASDKHGGICPSRDTWLLEYDPEKTSDIDTADVETSAESIPEFMPETDAVRWQKLPRGPPPRVGAAMAQGLNSFEDAYSGQRDIAILYSGSQRTDDLPSDQVMTMPHFDGGVVDIVSTTSRAWLHERVHYVGPEKQRQKTLDRRKGATLNAVRDVTSEETDIDQPSEYYLVFGGEFEDGSFTNALLKLSFDAFVESELIEDETPYTTRPMIHGILMFLSWGILMVIGTFSSRFAKDKEGKSRFFVVHVFVQLVALVLAWAGAGIAIYGRRRSNSSFAHGKIGLVALFLASFQPIMAVIGILLRLRNASSEIENRAKLSERLFPRICLFYHRTVGMAIIVLAAVNVTLGLFLIVAPATLWIQWIVYACLVFIAGLILEVIGGRRAGPDHMHAKVPSVNQGGISGGSSYPSCVVQSLKGESTADMLRRSTSSFGNRNKPAADEIPAENVSKGEETPWNGSQVGASFSSYSAQEKGTEHMEDALEQQLTELGVHFRNTGASQFSMRERLDSGTSLMSVYQDPDSY